MRPQEAKRVLRLTCKKESESKNLNSSPELRRAVRTLISTGYLYPTGIDNTSSIININFIASERAEILTALEDHLNNNGADKLTPMDTSFQTEDISFIEDNSKSIYEVMGEWINLLDKHSEDSDGSLRNGGCVQ